MKVLTILALTLPVLFSLLAFATGEGFEQACENKAKEIAKKAYGICVNKVIEKRNTQIDEIRENYKKDLAAVKEKYEGQLKSLEKEVGPKKKSAKPKKAVVEDTELEKPDVENADGSDAESI